MRQVRSKDLAQHDPLTRDIMMRLGGDVETRAAGGDLSPALEREVFLICLCPLDESCGEGYHRGTSHELARASASLPDHLKQAVRQTQELERVRRWTRRHGAKAKRIVRYEWVRWKRILQTKWSKRWASKKMKGAKVYKRIYHDDAKSVEDWRTIVNPEVDPRPPVTEDSTNQSQLENEYLAQVLRPGSYFGVPTRTQSLDEAGVPQVEEENTFSRWSIGPPVAVVPM